MTAMMDNMAPFLFALIAFGAAFMVTVTGMAATVTILPGSGWGSCSSSGCDAAGMPPLLAEPAPL
jgi:hypothetical protein